MMQRKPKHEKSSRTQWSRTVTRRSSEKKKARAEKKEGEKQKKKFPFKCYECNKKQHMVRECRSTTSESATSVKEMCYLTTTNQESALKGKEHETDGK